MKKTFLISSVLLLNSSVVLFGGVFKSPRSLPDLASTNQGEIFKVICEDHGSVDLQVLIYDSYGNELFSEKIAGMEGFIRPYDFSLLPEGKYRIDVIDGNGLYVEKVNYSNGEFLSLSPAPEAAKNDLGGKSLLTSENEVTVNVYDTDHHLVYSDTEKVTGTFAKVYHIKKRAQGISCRILENDT
jgi:hypothetical protein